MIELDDSRWATMRYAYGNTEVFPSLLQQLEDAATQEPLIDFEKFGDIWEVCHQWSTFDSTYAVLPHLSRICSKLDANSNFRIAMLQLFGWATCCLRLNKTVAAPDLIESFELSVAPTRELIGSTLTVLGEHESIRPLLGAYAACSGDPAIGIVLYELYDGTFNCEQCQTLIQPMRSGFNPFFQVNGG